MLAEIPDLEGDYSELSLGFNEELCLGQETSLTPSQSSSLHTPPSTSLPSTPTKESTKKEPSKTPSKIESNKSPPNPSPDKVVPKEEESTLSLTAPVLSPAVPIHRGDLIEFLVSDKTWFLVEVTGRGKLGGKNQNYLNVKYQDGSEGGVFIDQHQWRIVKRKEFLIDESPEAAGAIVSSRIHRVTVDIPSSCDETTEADTTTDDDIQDKPSVSVGASRKRKRCRKRKERMRKVSVDENIFEPSNNIKRGDVIEYVVKEQDGKE